MMSTIHDIQKLNLRSARTMERVESILSAAGLRFDSGVRTMFGLYDEGGLMCGCGGLDGNIIKCLALSDDCRGEGGAAALVSRLMDEAFAEGHTNVRVFTKPQYEELFRSMGFSLLGSSEEAVLLESDSGPLRSYCRYLAMHKADGVVVMNANPMTLGHLHLIRKAASQCGRIAVIPVAEHSSNAFSYKARLEMLKAATRDMPDVEIVEGSQYCVSRLSFPSYFLKRADDVSEAHARIDLDIFCRHLAPALGCTVRFVGTGPTDRLTAQYNAAMKAMLPSRGIRVVEVERLSDSGGPLSASRVRACLEAGRLDLTLPMVPRSDIPAMLAFLAMRALRMELELAPKPGLVDPTDSGSHPDMDYGLMSRGIEALATCFLDVATVAFGRSDIDTATLRRIGQDGERRMLGSTGGVNTHKGAIFSLGLAIAAAARLMSGNARGGLSEEIARLAEGFSRASGTNGSEIHQRFGVPTALDCARSGYRPLFDEWLPFLRRHGRTDETRLKLLLKIIGSLHDTNAIHRAGWEKASEARCKALALLDDFSVEGLHGLNDDFRQSRISHGGAADMLALTFFIDSIDDACMSESAQCHPTDN